MSVAVLVDEGFDDFDNLLLLAFGQLGNLIERPACPAAGSGHDLALDRKQPKRNARGSGLVIRHLG